MLSVLQGSTAQYNNGSLKAPSLSNTSIRNITIEARVIKNLAKIDRMRFK